MNSLRWGIFKGVQTCEAGIGTQAIPHAMAETNDPIAQGTLAMLSTYTAGFIAFLSGCVALITKTWLDPDLPLGINMVAASFELYFSSFGVFIIIVGAFLFAFGTIFGNGFNGSQCFGYLTKNKGLGFYIGGTAVLVFLGSIAEVQTVWSLIDIVLACVVIPHMGALIYYAYKNPAITKQQEGEIAEAEPIAMQVEI
jgi:AGCS family alanine or glycine:cation symporter